MFRPGCCRGGCRRGLPSIDQDVADVADVGAELVNAGRLGGNGDVIDVGAGSQRHEALGFISLEAHGDPAFLGLMIDGEGARDVGGVFAGDVDIKREGLFFVTPTGGDDVIDHDFVGDVVVDGHDINGNVLRGGGGGGGFDVALGGV